MEIMDIISESLTYPFNNLKYLIVYMVMGLIIGVITVVTGVGTNVLSSKGNIIALFVAAVGLILCLIISFLIKGYGLDIIKFGITRSRSSPEIDFPRQPINGLKYFIVSIVYFIVPMIITIVLSLIFSRWIVLIVGIILFIIFSLLYTMGGCRLAKTDDLSYSIDINSAFNDLINIGITKVLLTIIAVSAIMVIITFILSFVFNLISGPEISQIIIGIISVYFTFFSNRAMGLLYSEIA